MGVDPSPSAPAKRQTLSFLADLFRRHGLRPKNKLGQNFLVDLNLFDVIVRGADLTRADLAVEVGTGTGSLTGRLADLAGLVFSVEIDPAFHALAREHLRERPNVVLVRADILKNKNRLHPEVMAPLDEHRRHFEASHVKLVANLPYAVATPVICNFLMLDWSLERMVVTVQWEIAERLLAQPGTKDFGALAVLVQSLAEVEVLRRLPPEVFWPRPQVASAIVCIRPDAAKRAQVGDVTRFRHFLRDLYAHRRKNLRGALAGLPRGKLEKSFVDDKLADLDIDSGARAETLSLRDHRRLCEVFG